METQLKPYGLTLTMLCPVCWPEQNHTGALHEQRAQMAIAALAKAFKGRPIAGRHLFRRQPRPVKLQMQSTPLRPGSPHSGQREQRGSSQRICCS